MAGDQGNSEDLSLSVEETNALRAKLGLKPLAVKETTNKEAESVSNLVKLRADEAKAKKRSDLILKLQKEKEKARSVLSGPTLSAPEPGQSDDALSWIQSMRSKGVGARKELEKKAKEWDELEESVVYTSDNLKGLKVSHDANDFVEGESTILILKDARITDGLDNEDELMSLAMAESERERENAENKKKRPGYTAYEDEADMTGQKKELLAQYDNEIYGQKQMGFTLSHGGMLVKDHTTKEEPSISEKLKASAVSLDYSKNGLIQDYYTQEEMASSFRKPKKSLSGKKKKGRRKAPQEDEEEEKSIQKDENNDNEDVETSTSFSKSNKMASLENVNFVDDDDLQAALSRARKLASNGRKQNLASAKEIAQAIASIKQEAEDEEDHKGLVISETTEFIKTLLPASTLEPTKGKVADEQGIRPALLSQVKNEDKDIKMQSPIKTEEAQEPMEDVKREAGSDSDEEDEAIAQEPLVSGGMAATLALLSQKGVVQFAAPEERARQQKLRERELWLVEERKKEKLRQLELEKDRQRSRALEKSGRLTGREIERQREIEARRLEKEKLKLSEEKFKNYIPDVKIEYRDEFGRLLNTKEAYKQLAHKFHGKAPGKKKTEKRLQRIQEEIQLQKAMSSAVFDASSNAFLEAAKTSGTAHVTLSIGNRAAKLPERQNSIPSTFLPQTQEEAAPRTFEPAPAQPAPIIPDQREKIAFGFGLKRKLDNSDPSTNAQKKLKEDE